MEKPKFPFKENYFLGTPDTNKQTKIDPYIPEKNVTLEYVKRGPRAYALIIDNDGDKIWRSRGEYYELPEIDQDFYKFKNIDEFIEYVEKLDQIGSFGNETEEYNDGPEGPDAT